MPTAFMVAFTLVTSGPAVGDWWETHMQYHNIDECRFAIELLPPLVEAKYRQIKRYCQMESYGPNYSIVHYISERSRQRPLAGKSTSKRCGGSAARRRNAPVGPL